MIVWIVKKASILWCKKNYFDVLELSWLTFLNQATTEPSIWAFYACFISFKLLSSTSDVYMICAVNLSFYLWNHDLGIVSALPVEPKEQKDIVARKAEFSGFILCGWTVCSGVFSEFLSLHLYCITAMVWRERYLWVCKLSVWCGNSLLESCSILSWPPGLALL